MPFIAEFRVNPETVIAHYDFRVDAQHFISVSRAAPPNQRLQYGGPCTLSDAGTTNGVTRLSAANSGNDYYFPWVNRGIGEVNVPKAAGEGTIIVTGGMGRWMVEASSTRSS